MRQAAAHSLKLLQAVLLLQLWKAFQKRIRSWLAEYLHVRLTQKSLLLPGFMQKNGVMSLRCNYRHKHISWLLRWKTITFWMCLLIATFMSIMTKTILINRLTNRSFGKDECKHVKMWKVEFWSFEYKVWGIYSQFRFRHGYRSSTIIDEETNKKGRSLRQGQPRLRWQTDLGLPKQNNWNETNGTILKTAIT